MANTKMSWLGMLVLALVFGMTVVGCDNDSTDSDGNSGKKLTINGIALTGNVTVIINPETTPISGTVAYGTISSVTSGSNITMDLKQVNINNQTNPFTNSSWDGNGSFYILVYNRTSQQVMAEHTSPTKSFGPVFFSGKVTTVNW